MSIPTETNFTLDQICEGEGMKFQVINLEPLTVLCLEVEGHWKEYGRWKGHNGQYYKTWVPGETYKLYMGNSSIRNFNFCDSRLPWCSLYENGKVAHYR